MPVGRSLGERGGRDNAAGTRPRLHDDALPELRTDALAAEIKQAGGTAVVCPTDVTKEGDILGMIKTATDTFGRLDILVNNAGIAVHKPTTEVTTAEWRHIVDTNLTAVFIASREAM